MPTIPWWNEKVMIYYYVPISVPEIILPNITSDSNVNDDVDSATSFPVVTLRRSVRPKKPIERYVAGSK